MTLIIIFRNEMVVHSESDSMLMTAMKFDQQNLAEEVGERKALT